MNDPPKEDSEDESTLAGRIGAKAARKLRARKSTSDVWFGLGMMGLVGWSVVVPTLFGAALGVWLDKHHPGTHPWTLALMVVGLTVGCLNAWYWVAQQGRAMGQGGEDADE